MLENYLELLEGHRQTVKTIRDVIANNFRSPSTEDNKEDRRKSTLGNKGLGITVYIMKLIFAKCKLLRVRFYKKTSAWRLQYKGGVQYNVDIVSLIPYISNYH